MSRLQLMLSTLAVIATLVGCGGDATPAPAPPQIVDKIAATTAAGGAAITPGLTTLDDLASYQAVRRDPICTPYRGYTVCGVPPPSSGGIAVAQTLGILGSFDLAAAAPPAPDREGGVPGVDGIHLTSTIESPFGSFHMTAGVVLNNELTDFSAEPADPTGAPIANRVAGGKRPRSSMAPTLVFRTAADGSRGDFVMATGSPGGAAIIQYVVKTLVGVLDWQLDAQQSAGLLDFGAANDPTTNLGGESPNVDPTDDGAHDPRVQALRARGHQVSVAVQSSGVATVVRSGAGLAGGADPRREGIVLGDWFAPAPARR